MGLSTTQHEVTGVNQLELFQAFANRSTKRNEAILKERVAIGTDTSPVTVEIDGEPTHGFLTGISYPEDVTAACTLRTPEHEIAFTLTAQGWKGTATSSKN